MSHHGVLVVDKPVGPTSHDVVAQARRLLHTREVGHAGTLDPAASGVLVLMVGEATKLSNYLTPQHKQYIATIEFGRATDSWDAEGNTVLTTPLTPGQLHPDRIRTPLEAERLRTLQVPPPYSAIQVGGVRAHRASRRGESLVLAPRLVQVHSLELVDCSEREITVRLAVSKGYYVRSLAHDLGERIGAPAHLARLRRLASGPFTLDEALTWPPTQVPLLMSVADAARRSLPTVQLTQRGRQRAFHGQPLADSDFVAEPPHTLSAWLAQTGELIALGQPSGQDVFRVVRGFRRSIQDPSASVSAHPDREPADPKR